MKKLKLIVSDFHLGRGRRLPNGSLNPLEDFFFEGKFKEFLEYYSSPPYDDCDTELIFNGDMFNLIQIDYHGHYTVILTEAVSMHKLKALLDGHPVFFDCLKRFLSHPNRKLTFIVGNHDQEMLWKGCRTMLEERLGKAVDWKNTHYQVDGIHIEHGHQYEAVNRFDPTRPFLTENLPEPILNLPWGTLFTIQFIVRMKQKRHFIDKVRPFRMLIWRSLVYDTWVAITSLFKLASYFVSTRFSKNRYRQSSLKTTLRILFETSVFPDLSDAARRILRSPSVHTVTFGHTHVYKQMQVGEGKQYINTGTWTDIISLDLESYARRSKMTYIRVDYDEAGNAVPLLRHWIGRVPLEDDASPY